MDQYSVIIWQGHGGYCKQQGSFISIKDSYYQVKNAHSDDINSKRILCSTDGNALVCGSFFTKYYKNNSFNNLIIYISTCEGGVDSRLADSFLNLGAKTVYASSNTTYTNYDSAMIRDVFAYIADGKTTGEALKYAQSVNGKTYALPKGGEVEVLLFGDSDMTLNKMNDAADQKVYMYNFETGILSWEYERDWSDYAYTSDLNKWNEYKKEVENFNLEYGKETSLYVVNTYYFSRYIESFPENEILTEYQKVVTSAEIDKLINSYHG